MCRLKWRNKAHLRKPLPIFRPTLTRRKTYMIAETCLLGSFSTTKRSCLDYNDNNMISWWKLMLKKFPFFDTDLMCCEDQKIRLKQLQSGGSYRALMAIYPYFLEELIIFPTDWLNNVPLIPFPGNFTTIG